MRDAGVPSGFFRFRGVAVVRRHGWLCAARVERADGTVGWERPIVTCPLGHRLSFSTSILNGADTLFCAHRLSDVELRRFPERADRTREADDRRVCGARVLFMAVPGYAEVRSLWFADVNQHELDRMERERFDPQKMFAL